MIGSAQFVATTASLRDRARLDHYTPWLRLRPSVVPCRNIGIPINCSLRSISARGRSLERSIIKDRAFPLLTEGKANEYKKIYSPSLRSGLGYPQCINGGVSPPAPNREDQLNKDNYIKNSSCLGSCWKYKQQQTNITRIQYSTEHTSYILDKRKIIEQRYITTHNNKQQQQTTIKQLNKQRINITSVLCDQRVFKYHHQAGVEEFLPIMEETTWIINNGRMQ